MAKTVETVPPERQNRPEESSEQVVEHVFELPLAAQLGVLRTIAPKILAQLHGEELDGFLRDLNDEIGRAERGEPSYDLRTYVQTH